MPVYQPTAVLGNSHLLVTIGARGEIMALFFPHLDFPQNVHEGMPAVYAGAPREGQLSWTFDEGWQSKQHYAADANTLITELFHPEWQLQLVITDFVHPEHDLLVRKFAATNRGRKPFQGSVFQFLDLDLGEQGHKDGLRFLPDRNIMVQYWRSLAVVLGGDPFKAYQCGRAHTYNSAKGDLEDGVLNSNPEEIGDVDCALGWNFNLKPKESAECVLYLAIAYSELGAAGHLQSAEQEGYAELQAQTDAHWSAWLARAKPVKDGNEVASAYRRCLLTLPLLCDADYGAILAAPEFDPIFEASGGYGYCWPRDAAEAAIALDTSGYPELTDAFFEWCHRVQHPDGYWEQRYWLSGERGAAWCTFDDRLQIDQTASVLHAFHRLWRQRQTDDGTRWLNRCWPCLRKGADYLTKSLQPNGLHRPGIDLWETFQGTFTYTNAAIHAALMGASHLATVLDHPQQAKVWQTAAAHIKTACLELLWTGTHFARRIAENGELDVAVDSSILGVLEPLDMLSLDDDREREMIETSVKTIIARLGVQLAEGPAIARFEGDGYLGGAVGGVNTLWLCRVLLRLALWYQPRDAARAKAYRVQGESYLHTVLRRVTPAGLLPELIGKPGQPAYWAAPHAWAMGSLVLIAHLLDQFE